MAGSTTLPLTQPKPNLWRWVFLIGRVLLGLMFVYAAYTKLREPWMLFAMAVESYKLLPEWAAIFVARSLPWFELVLGLALVSGILFRWSATIASLLLAFFFGLMVYTYHVTPKGQAVYCGCFGSGEPIGPWTLARDGTLLALALAVTYGAFFRSRKHA